MAELSPAEQTALQTVGGVAAIPPSILANAIAEAISAIRSGGNAVDAAGNTIPDIVRPHVIAIVRWRWLCSMPELEGIQTPERQKQAARGEDFLARIASQDPKRPRVELPANADTASAPVAAAVIARPGRRVQNFDKLGGT